jgi:phage terminase large subunit-like protein
MTREKYKLKDAEKWVRNKADELAIEQGCRFDAARGQLVIDFAERHLRLYEGDYAGQPFVAHDWQIEATMRLFGWVRWSDRHKRWIRRFRSANIWIPKKNKKSPTLAWWGLYLLIGDGEQGGKTFFVAKDGTQARDIAGKHAITMIENSPDLSEITRINLSTCTITDLDTNSILRPLAVGDARSQKSKEGLNGSALIDEVHVVDREAMNRLSRMGISRSEPLLVGVSTAGNDLQSYGFEQWEIGEAINAGTIENIYHLHCSYHAPQELTDSELASDPMKYIAMANPALGHTIDPDEILSDYKASCNSSRELSLFKMYRLNIWQGGTNPWLRTDLWASYRNDLDTLLADLKGRECWAGLDLSKTIDTTALVLVFPPRERGEKFSCLPYFWLPYDTAEAMKDKVPYSAWAKSGHIELTPGNVTDYSYIRTRLADLKQQFDVRSVLFDPFNASHFALELLEDGIQMQECRQTFSNLSEPTKELERLVLSNGITHPGNLCMDWQVANARTCSDTNSNIRIVKPKHGDIRKVDGPAALVMGMLGALTTVKRSWWFDQENASFPIIENV